MSALTIEHSWVDLDGTERPEILATFANLEIRVNGEIVTHVLSQKSQTARKTVLVPLYVVAQWIVANWWVLNEEAEVKGRSSFVDRHSLLRAGSGYCLPDLRFLPEGLHTRLEWHRHAFTYAPLEFVEDGFHRAASSDVFAALADFVEVVGDRLAGAGIRDSWVQREWEAIKATEADPDELEYCRAAAWMGLDPYSLSDEEARTIERQWTGLPTELREDALRATSFDQLDLTCKWIDRTLALQHDGNGIDQRLVQIRPRHLNTGGSHRPWKTGYQLAHTVIEAMDGSENVPVSLEDWFGGQLPVRPAGASPGNVDALASLGDGVICYTAKTRDDSRRFLAARALFDFLTTSADFSLLTTAQTDRQIEGRAFAAELLAPAARLRTRIHSESLMGEDVADLAHEFQVSTYVIAYQIRNHNLAALMDDMSGPS